VLRCGQKKKEIRLMKNSAGKKFRDAVKEAVAEGAPLHIIGVADGSDALEAERAGFQAVYVSGSQIAASRGWADIGRIELKHVVENLKRIMDSGVDLPILVDIDTGFDNVSKTIKTLEKMGIAAVHLEDQEDLKACGHLPGKHVIAKEKAAARIKKAVKAKKDKDFVVMARTDALAVEGMEKTLARISAYVRAGADMVFAEAFPDLNAYAAVKKAARGRPVLANMTEFGKVELKTPQELQKKTKGAVDMVLNPLTVYRAQRQVAEKMYAELQAKGTQRGMEPQLQKREDFQSLINYPAQVADRARKLKR
jgi:methylisocitrate lyase